MRRHLSLPVVLLVLFFVGTVTAQQPLAEYNDKNDPCNRFKMRILMPVDNAGNTERIKKIEDGIDYKMVLNPCPPDRPQFAFVTIPQKPDGQGSLLVQPTSRFSALKNSGPKDRSKLPLPAFPALFKLKGPQQE